MGHDVENPTSHGTPCRFAEIVQYNCHVEKNSSGTLEAHCFPIPRIFKLQVQVTRATVSYWSLLKVPRARSSRNYKVGRDRSDNWWGCYTIRCFQVSSPTISLDINSMDYAKIKSSPARSLLWKRPGKMSVATNAITSSRTELGAKCSMQFTYVALSTVDIRWCLLWVGLRNG